MTNIKNLYIAPYDKVKDTFPSNKTVTLYRDQQAIILSDNTMDELTQAHGRFTIWNEEDFFSNLDYFSIANCPVFQLQVRSDQMCPSNVTRIETIFYGDNYQNGDVDSYLKVKKQFNIKEKYFLPVSPSAI